MTTGTPSPAAAPPTDRFALLRQAQARHAAAVEQYEEAQQLLFDAINALPIPELMQGPIVRVTDLTTAGQARTVLELTVEDEAERDRLLKEVTDYRAERQRLAEYHGIADLAEMVAITAAAVAREGRG
jgi:hypothetical protein